MDYPAPDISGLLAITLGSLITVYIWFTVILAETSSWTKVIQKENTVVEVVQSLVTNL